MQAMPDCRSKMVLIGRCRPVLDFVRHVSITFAEQSHQTLQLNNYMQARRPANPATKKMAGTYRKDRHGEIEPITIVDTSKVPEAPEWLSEGAKTEWASTLAHAVACGATAIDSSMFALYCETMAVFVAEVQSGQTTNAAYRSELRKQMELLGIAGAKSRLAKIGTPDAPKASPFTVRK
jgi:hypothetical protein